MFVLQFTLCIFDDRTFVFLIILDTPELLARNYVSRAWN